MNVNRRKFLSLGGFALLWSSRLKGRDYPHPSPVDMKKAARNCAEPWLEIDLDNIAWNIQQIRKRVKNVPIMAVIKANAYGFGLVPIAQFLEKQGIRYMAVGKLQEALQLREAGIKAHILNLGPLCPTAAEEIIRNDIAQSVFTDDVHALSEAAQKLKKRALVHIKIDTGLSRVGIPYHKALPFIKKVHALKGISIAGTFTHFIEDDEFDVVQLNHFTQLCQKAQDEGIGIGLKHVMSSDGILRHSKYFDMVRPGIMIYGHYPSFKAFDERLIDLKPALQLKTRIVNIKELQPGDGVSYHHPFVARKKELVATLPIGYSDRLPTGVVNKAQVLIQGKRYPLVAAVTANHCTALITGSEGIEIGDEAVFIGTQGEENITAEELAKHADASIYRLLIGFNPFLPRIYHPA